MFYMHYVYISTCMQFIQNVIVVHGLRFDSRYKNRAGRYDYITD